MIQIEPPPVAVCPGRKPYAGIGGSFSLDANSYERDLYWENSSAGVRAPFLFVAGLFQIAIAIELR